MDDILLHLRGTGLSVFGLRPATEPGAPATGTFTKGELWCDSDGVYWRCTVAGTPGTWEEIGSGGGGGGDAEDIMFTPAGNIAATDVQAAIEELDAEKSGTSHTHDIAAVIHAATSKSTPADADELGLVDSAASNVLKRLTWANIKSTLQTWLGTLRDATKVSKLVASDGSPDPALSADSDGNLTAVGDIYLTNPDCQIAWNVSGMYAYLKGVDIGSNPSRIEWHVEPPAGGTAENYLQAGSLGAGATLIMTHVDGTPANDEIGGYIGSSNQFSVKSGGLALASGARINEFSTDGTMGGNSDTAVPTEKAVQTYVDTKDAAVVATTTHGASSKSTPVDADELPLVDSADSNALKKLTWANLKATLQTWLGTLQDATKVSKLVASDGSPDPAWSTDAAGQLSGATGLDIFPQASANGLNARFERLFGDDVPANAYQFTRRTFVTNAFTSNIAGFEDSQSSPYSFGGSPGGFSLSVPASSYSAESSSYPHWLYLRNFHASTPLYLEWTSSTAKNIFNFIMAVTPNPAASDLLVAEIRGWGVQSPGGSDNYWAFRWQWLGSSVAAYPFVLSAYRGTGTTFAVGDGTMLQRYQAVIGQVNAILIQPQASNTCAFISRVAEGFNNFSAGFAQAGYPSNFKTMRLYLPANSYHEVFLDQVVIT